MASDERGFPPEFRFTWERGADVPGRTRAGRSLATRSRRFCVAGRVARFRRDCREPLRTAAAWGSPSVRSVGGELVSRGRKRTRDECCRISPTRIRKSDAVSETSPPLGDGTQALHGQRYALRPGQADARSRAGPADDERPSQGRALDETEGLPKDRTPYVTHSRPIAFKWSDKRSDSSANSSVTRR